MIDGWLTGAKCAVTILFALAVARSQNLPNATIAKTEEIFHKLLQMSFTLITDVLRIFALLAH